MTGDALFRRSLGVASLLLVVGHAVAASVYQLQIPEITSNQCTARIESALLNLGGVREVSSDVAAQTVTVEMVSGYRLVPEEVVSAVGALGFSVRKFEVFDTGEPGAR